MNSTLNEPCGHADAGKQRPELAVLFHLVDVSRPRTAPRPDQPPTLPLDQPPLRQTTTAADEKTDFPPLAPSASVPDYPLPSLSSLLPPTAEAKAKALPLTQPAVPLYSLAGIEGAVTAPSPATVEHAPSPIQAEAVVEPPSAKQEPVTPASPPTSSRRLRTPPTEAWFASHGKYIAAAFVLALIGTVYLANTKRRHSDATHASASTPAAPTAGATPDVTSAHHVHSVSAVSDSKVELHPPVAVQLVAESSGDAKSPAGDTLFSFPAPKKSDERVASRPEAPKSTEAAAPAPSTERATPASAELSAPATGPIQHVAPAAQPAGSTTAPPAVGSPGVPNLPSSYPVTTAPPLVTASPPAAYSAPPAAYAPPQAAYSAPPPAYSGPPQAGLSQPHDYRSQFPVQPSAYQPATPQQPPSPAPGYSPPGAYAPAAYQPGAYQPGAYQPVQPARGPRNERIGSGNY